jgi:transcriptional regulator GlxA family with amidase domain
MEADLAREWDLADLAREAGLEASALTRRFRRAFGLPPMAWLNRRRAERAGALLVATARPISVIGAEVGWFAPATSRAASAPPPGRRPPSTAAGSGPRARRRDPSWPWRRAAGW